MVPTQLGSSSAQNIAETASGSQTKADLKAGDMHNIRAFLTKNKLTRDCDKMIDYLMRSRIHTAITATCTAYASHQQEFWRTAAHDEAMGGIRGLVQEQPVFVLEEVLNELLELGDATTDPISLNICRVKGCLLRCGYTGEIRNESVFKTKFCSPYRYLMHVISHCLGPRRTGHDQLNQTFSHLFVALVLNVKFNISRVIFNCLKENLSKNEGRFFMYPRFLQIVIDTQVEGLVKEDGDKIKLRHMNDQTVRQMSRYMGTTAPLKRKLICHLGDKDYKAPERKHLWRNEGSESQVENIEIVSDDEDEEPEVQSQEAHDPTGGEAIPTELDEMNVDVFFEDDKDEQTRKRKEKAAINEPEKKKKKVYKFKSLVASVEITVRSSTATAAPASTAAQGAAGSSQTGSQIPNISVEESLSKLQSYVLDMIKDEKERKLELEEVKMKMVEKDLQIENLLKKDAKREVKMIELEKKNETMERILIEYTQEFKRLKAHVEKQDEEVLKLKEFAESEPAGAYSGDEEDPLIVQPLKAEIPQSSRLLSVQGQIVSQEEYEAEEGEILPFLSREQIAELLQIPIENVIIDEDDQSSVPQSEAEKEPIFDTDEVEIEDETDQHYPSQQTDDDLPDLADVFKTANAEEINRRAEVREQENVDFDLEKYLGDRKSKQEEREARRKKYIRFLERQAGKEKKSESSPEYTKFYKTLGKKTHGAIVGWCYIPEFNVYAIKRERGVEYFQRANDIQTLPFYDIRQLARLPLLDCEDQGMAKWFETLVKREARFGWKNLKPYVPGVKSHPTKIDPLTGRKLKVLNCKAPQCMKKLPLKTMPTDWSARFKWWYFNEKTTEAVIVLDDELSGGETIRVFNPMWMKNFGKNDITVLYYNPILYKDQYMDLALQFQKVVRVCFVFDIYAGSQEIKSTTL